MDQNRRIVWSGNGVDSPASREIMIRVAHFEDGGLAMDDVIYDENVNYDALEKHVYKDSGDAVFYTCPICGGEYLATFITKENGRTMCIDCWSKRYGD